jgi:hypothetical protein
VQAALEPAGWEKWYSVEKLSMGLGSKMSQSSILIDALSSACWEKKEKQPGAFFPRVGQASLAVPHRFSWLLGAIKG